MTQQLEVLVDMGGHSGHWIFTDRREVYHLLASKGGFIDLLGAPHDEKVVRMPDWPAQPAADLQLEVIADFLGHTVRWVFTDPNEIRRTGGALADLLEQPHQHARHPAALSRWAMLKQIVRGTFTWQPQFGG
jgi:hypothetical protein